MYPWLTAMIPIVDYVIRHTRTNYITKVSDMEGSFENDAVILLA